VLAAISPDRLGAGRAFDFLSGTSMASPHVAGLAALFKTKYPTWSPMAIKSALMTTAYNLKGAGGSSAADPFAQGAGHVDPSRMFNPALVYDASDDDWLGVLEGLGVDTGIDVDPIDPSDYNQASMAAGDVLVSQTVTREVTALTPGLYRATANVPGFRAVVTPSILSFTAPGQTQTFRVTLTRTNAAFGSFATGFLTWNGANTTVRSPIAVRPSQLAASAARVEGDSQAGQFTASWQVTAASPANCPSRSAD
jgi:subtilisin family serine protease